MLRKKEEHTSESVSGAATQQQEVMWAYAEGAARLPWRQNRG